MGQPRILIIDDDATHLNLYSWILQRERFLTATALVQRHGVDLPTAEERFDLTLLDYRLLTGIKAVDVANQVRARWPGMQIVVLSDMMWLPDDMASIANGFVRKGEPEMLIKKLSEMIETDKNPGSGLA